MSDLLLPYGAIVFALWGLGLIPEAEEFLREDKTQTGICEEDVISSIADTHAQNLDLNMQDALDEYIHDYSLDITSCDKAIVLSQAR